MAMKSRAAGPRVPVRAGAENGGRRSVVAWLALSVLFLLAMGAIHLYLVLDDAAGTLATPFVLNAVGALVLATAMVVLRQRLLLVASVLSTLFMLGTLLALVLALTVGLFGVHEVLSYELVRTTLVVESIGTIVLAVTTVLVYRRLPADQRRSLGLR